MSFSIGIVGLPNVGKSTLFKALTKKQVDIANYPFCTIDPNVGVVKVPDERLEKLAILSKSEKIIPTTIEFVDIAGLVKGASQGEGLGNQFLSHIREVDAIIEIVRNFEDKNIIHIYNEINPKNDQEVINLELVMADLDVVKKRLEKINSQIKGTHEKIIDQQKEVYEKLKNHLEQGQMANSLIMNEDEKHLIKDLNLLSIKPLIYVLNIDEHDLDKVNNFQNIFPGNVVLPLAVKLEAEIADLDETEAKKYLVEMGIKESGLDQLIKLSYQLLNLITFITTGPKDTRAWTCLSGTKAPQAAGVIHTDFEKGFIRAEIINWQDLLNIGGDVAAKEKGLMRMEGKDYVIKDGDVVHFHFN
jgi:ribosome-binding ATPase